MICVMYIYSVIMMSYAAGLDTRYLILVPGTGKSYYNRNAVLGNLILHWLSGILDCSNCLMTLLFMTS